MPRTFPELTMCWAMSADASGCPGCSSRAARTSVGGGRTLSQKGARTRLEQPGPTLVRADVQSSRQSGLRPHQARLRCIWRRQPRDREAGLNRVLYERSRAATMAGADVDAGKYNTWEKLDIRHGHGTTGKRQPTGQALDGPWRRGGRLLFARRRGRRSRLGCWRRGSSG